MNNFKRSIILGSYLKRDILKRALFVSPKKYFCVIDSSSFATISGFRICRKMNDKNIKMDDQNVK
jgi:hypothetical protein